MEIGGADRRGAAAAPLVVIIGPVAVGKMTVGQELARLTGFKLVYNHMVIDFVTEFFPFESEPFGRLAQELKVRLITAFARSGCGAILTWGFAHDELGIEELDELAAAYARHGGATYFAELTAGVDVRVARNATANRRAHKKKLGWATEEYIRGLDAETSTVARAPFPYPERYMLIDNTDVPAADAAMLIKERFGL